MKTALSLLLPLLLIDSLRAREPASGSTPPTQLPATEVLREIEDPQSKLATLSALADSIRLREQQREQLQRDVERAVDPAQRTGLLEDLGTINRELDTMRRQFQSIALETDIDVFEGEPKKEFDLQSEVLQLAEPLIERMKAATKESRELTELKSRLEANRLRLRTAEEALANLESLPSTTSDPALEERLASLKGLWEDRLRDTRNQIRVVENQLRQRGEGRKSAVETAKESAKNFIRSSGLNLLLGILAFAAVFLGMRGVHAALSKIRPGGKKGRSFSTRLTALVWNVVTLLAAIGALLATFNFTGDLFLFSLTLVFLLGVGWAGIKALPGLIEQFRMMLNMGAVREDERLIYQDIPWKVNAIGFRTELVNPELDGGVLHLPTRMLVGLLSRPPGKNEEWFPSREKDWVTLSDGAFGRVAYQTPSAVQLVAPGGSHTVIPTPQYLSLAPTVLSTGFRREIVFGLHYKHQADITGAIPERMRGHLEEALTQRLGGELSHLDVLFAEAADSSLNLVVMVDCKGGAAAKWMLIPRWVQSALLDLCNQEGWEIPFPQLQIHSDS